MSHLQYKKILPLIFVIDCSGGAAGEFMSSINEGMHIIIANLKNNTDEYKIKYDCEIRLTVLVYSSNARWLTCGELQSVLDFEWHDQFAAGLSNLGAALLEIQSKLSPRELLCLSEKILRPTIIYVVEGTSSDDYIKQLNCLRENNKYYSKSNKICIGFNYADERMVGSLAEKGAHVLIADSPDELREIIGSKIIDFLPDFMDTRAKVYAYEEKMGEVKPDGSVDDLWE